MAYPVIFSTPGLRALASDVDEERQRQWRVWGDQRHPDGTSPEYAIYGVPFDQLAIALQSYNAARRIQPGEDTLWAPVLLEEVAEAFCETDPAKLRAELVQAAAVIAAWVYDIDRR